MTRYFKTTNASRPYPIGGGVRIHFEPLQFMGGAWAGALAVTDNGKAAALATHGPPVEEINEEEYARLKKKRFFTPRDSRISLGQPIITTGAQSAGRDVAANEPPKPLPDEESVMVAGSAENIRDELE